MRWLQGKGSFGPNLKRLRKKKKKGGENNGEEGHLRNKHQYTQSIVNTIAYVVTGANLLTTTIHT